MHHKDHSNNVTFGCFDKYLLASEAMLSTSLINCICNDWQDGGEGREGVDGGPARAAAVPEGAGGDLRGAGQEFG